MPAGAFVSSKKHGFPISMPAGAFLSPKKLGFPISMPAGAFSSKKARASKLVNTGSFFPGKCAEFVILSSMCGLPGVLNRIHRIHSDPPDPLRSAGNGVRPGRTDPGFPTPGGRMTVVYTNSLKLLVRCRRRPSMHAKTKNTF